MLGEGRKNLAIAYETSLTCAVKEQCNALGGDTPVAMLQGLQLEIRAPRTVQMGGMALHEGTITEMPTGEGKTLAATLPAYLNALSGAGVHVVTVNDYLAKRDSEW